VLLTGDNIRAARAVAARVGIDEVIAEVTPEGKAEAVTRLQAEGKVVAMVGDGVNDAAALARADLGLAMGTGTDAAIEAGDLTLVRGDLLAVADAIRLSRRTLGTIEGNLFWAFAYNVAALPLACMGLLNPLIAGAAMAASSILVVSNSLRLRRFQAASALPDAAPGDSGPAVPGGSAAPAPAAVPAAAPAASAGHTPGVPAGQGASLDASPAPGGRHRRPGPIPLVAPAPRPSERRYPGRYPTGSSA